MGYDPVKCLQPQYRTASAGLRVGPAHCQRFPSSAGSLSKMSGRTVIQSLNSKAPALS